MHMSQDKPLPGSDILTIGTLALVIAYMNFKVCIIRDQEEQHTLNQAAGAEKASLEI